VAVVGMPFCFLVENFADIGQSVNEFIELWPKSDFQDGGRCHLELKNFNFWSRDCNRVQYMM